MFKCGGSQWWVSVVRHIVWHGMFVFCVRFFFFRPPSLISHLEPDEKQRKKQTASPIDCHLNSGSGRKTPPLFSNETPSGDLPTHLEEARHVRTNTYTYTMVIIAEESSKSHRWTKKKADEVHSNKNNNNIDWNDPNSNNSEATTRIRPTRSCSWLKASENTQTMPWDIFPRIMTYAPAAQLYSPVSSKCTVFFSYCNFNHQQRHCPSSTQSAENKNAKTSQQLQVLPLLPDRRCGSSARLNDGSPHDSGEDTRKYPLIAK